MAGAAAALITVLRAGATDGEAVAQEQAIATGIASKSPKLTLPFDPTPLLARFAIAKVDLQKRAIKEIQRALAFEMQRATWTQTRATACQPSAV